MRRYSYRTIRFLAPLLGTIFFFDSIVDANTLSKADAKNLELINLCEGARGSDGAIRARACEELLRNPNIKRYGKRMAYLSLGMAYQAQGALPEAIDAYTKAIRFDKTFALAYAERGAVYTKLGRTDLARSDYWQAVKLSKPKAAYEFANRCVTYLNLDEIESAIKDCTKAIELNSEYPEGFFHRGDAYTRLKEYKSAISDYNRALELRPNNSHYYGQRARALAADKQLSKALSDANEAVRLGPDNVFPLTARAYVHSQIGNYEEALSDYQKAFGFSPYDNQIKAAIESTQAKIKEAQKATRPSSEYSAADVARLLKAPVADAPTKHTGKLDADETAKKLEQRDGKLAALQSETKKQANDDTLLSEFMPQAKNLRAHIMAHWSPPVGSETLKARFVVRVKLARNGTLSEPPQIIVEGNDAPSPAVSESILKAIFSAQPYSMLKDKYYDVWKDMDIGFEMPLAAK